jgi:hypothetical protein
VKRVRSGSTNVTLAIIDAKELHQTSNSPSRRRLFYSMELVGDPLAKDWANNPQEILVFAYIPKNAVISTIGFDTLMKALPNFFFSSASSIIRAGFGTRTRAGPWHPLD